jgi:hypothetical protein
MQNILARGIVMTAEGGECVSPIYERLLQANTPPAIIVEATKALVAAQSAPFLMEALSILS